MDWWSLLYQRTSEHRFIGSVSPKTKNNIQFMLANTSEKPFLPYFFGGFHLQKTLKEQTLVRLIVIAAVVFSASLAVGIHLAVHKTFAETRGAQAVPTGNTRPAGISLGVSLSQDELVDATNKIRRAHGLSPLSKSSQLTNAALAKAQDMAENHYFAHISLQMKTPWNFIEGEYEYVYAGENLAMNFTDTSRVMDAWMQSPDHRKNILAAEFEDVGIAIGQAVIDGKETIIVVQFFGQNKTDYEASVINRLKALPHQQI